MSKYAQGIFTPRHPEKYIGKGSIKYRSSWEFAFFTFCDNHPSVLQWASESVKIPYRNPIKGKQTVYVPDVLIVYQDKNGQTHCELIEIKPGKETTMEAAKSPRDKLMVAQNYAKWAACRAWCQMQGITFRVVTETDLFHSGTR